MFEVYLFETKFIDSGRAERHFRKEESKSREKETVRKREILREDILRGEMEMRQRVKKRG